MKKRQLVAIGHLLSPVVTVGNKGLSETVIEELERALDDHELIKVKLQAEREQRKVLVEQICSQLCAELIQQVGKIILILRRAEQPKLKTSNLLKAMTD